MNSFEKRVLQIVLCLGALTGCAKNGYAPGIPILKYLFVVDQSAMNQQNYIFTSASTSFVDPDGGTDITGTRRYSGLITFLQNNQATSKIFYSTLFFNTSPIVPFSSYTGGGQNEDTSGDSIWYTSSVQNTTTYLAQQVINIWCAGGGTYPNCNTPQGDGGFTDYHDPLISIQNYIQQDATYQQTLQSANQGPVSSSYVIFWVSSLFGNTASGVQSSSEIINDVQNIMSLTSNPYVNSITFNTGFYTTVGALSSWGAENTESLMSNMSSAGQGTFVNFGATGNIDYSQFPIPSILK